jgi:hypothetical protein
MAEDRLTVLEGRVAALERELAALRSAVRPASGGPPVSAAANDPLKGHPLISPRMPPDAAAAWDARILRELGIDHLEPLDPATVQQMMIDEDGLDPNGNEFSRGIIEMRQE